MFNSNYAKAATFLFVHIFKKHPCILSINFKFILSFCPFFLKLTLYFVQKYDIKSRELGDALELLEMAGLVYKVYHTGSNGIPLKAESDTKRFKVLFFDVGLAERLLKLDHRPLLLNPDISRVNKGAIAELFTGLEFITYQDFREKAGLYYWHREAKSSNAEVDYVISIGSKILPVEVKSSSSGTMKSLRLFMETKNSELGVKVSGFNFSLFEKILTIPFYAIESLVKGDESEKRDRQK